MSAVARRAKAEAIRPAAWTEWIASAFALWATADTSPLSLLAMTIKSPIEPEIIVLEKQQHGDQAGQEDQCLPMM